MSAQREKQDLEGVEGLKLVHIALITAGQQGLSTVEAFKQLKLQGDDLK